MAEGLTALFITILLLGIAVAYLKWKHDKEFGEWHLKIINLAKEQGIPENEIEVMDPIWFWDYFLEDMSPEEALNNYLKTQE